MCPSPTITTVFQFFQNGPQPLTADQIRTNFKDVLLAEMYLSSLVADGLIFRNEQGFHMSPVAIEAALIDCAEKIRGWEERRDHLKQIQKTIISKSIERS